MKTEKEILAMLHSLEICEGDIVFDEYSHAKICAGMRTLKWVISSDQPLDVFKDVARRIPL